MLLLKPVLRYSYPRDAFVLRVVGRRVGPVLRTDRRVRQRQLPDGFERRASTV